MEESGEEYESGEYDNGRGCREGVEHACAGEGRSIGIGALCRSSFEDSPCCAASAFVALNLANAFFTAHKVLHASPSCNSPAPSPRPSPIAQTSTLPPTRLSTSFEKPNCSSSPTRTPCRTPKKPLAMPSPCLNASHCSTSKASQHHLLEQYEIVGSLVAYGLGLEATRWGIAG